MILAQALIALTGLAYLKSLLSQHDLISSIAQQKYNGGWKFAAAIITIFTLQITIVIYAPGKSGYQTTILILTLLTSTSLLFLNHHLPGAKLAILGAILNITVVLANGGWMPLTPETANFIHPDRPPVELQTKPPSSKNIILNKNNTKLWLLSDIIRITLPWRNSAISIGDILLITGFAQFVLISRKEKHARTKVPLL